MTDDLSNVDMSQWQEITQLRKFVSLEGVARRIKLVSGYGGVGRAYWRSWLAEAWKPLDEKVYGPTEEVLAVAVIE